MKKRIYNDTFWFEIFLVDKKKHYPSQIPERAQAIANIKPDTAYLYIKEADYQIIAHECVHIAQGLLHYKGIKTGYKNTEVLAYVTDWIYWEVLKYYK
jgi:hypothetical protein